MLHGPAFPEEKVVMLRYGELFLKSEPVKRHFVGLLLRNCGRALESAGLSFRAEVHRGRILLHGEKPDEIARILSRIFGVVDVSVCTRTTPDPEAVKDAAVVYATARLHRGQSFAVRARRQGVEGLSSQELAADVGSAIINAIPGAWVDLGSPEYEIFVELREFGGLVYDTRLPAPGGLPWGTQGKILALLSSGIDSPVAIWQMMRRGCEVDALHIHSGPYAGRDVLPTALRHLSILSTWCSGFPMRLYQADAGHFYETLIERATPRLRCVLCKRFMMHLGSELAMREGHLALCTGDSLGQVASQTMANLAVVSGAATVPLLRPLLAFDKQETVRLAKKIGTFDSHPGDLACSVVPKIAATQSKPDEIKTLEEVVEMQSHVSAVLENIRMYTALNGRIETI